MRKLCFLSTFPSTLFFDPCIYALWRRLCETNLKLQRTYKRCDNESCSLSLDELRTKPRGLNQWFPAKHIATCKTMFLFELILMDFN